MRSSFATVVIELSLSIRIALSALRRPERYSYGPEPSQCADLHRPKGDGPHPVAVVIHGGYWQASYGKLITRPLCIDLARRGWAAWNIEYRRIGRGQGGGWPATFADVAAGIDHLAAVGDLTLDLADLTVIGHSAGGQLALWAGSRPDLLDTTPGSKPVLSATRVIALAPVTDLRRAGDTAHALIGGTPEEVPDRYTQSNPIQQAPLGVPVLLSHPRDDRTVSVKGSRAYAQAALASGADVTLLEPAGIDHSDITNPTSDGWKEVAAWLAQRTSARPASVSDTSKQPSQD